MTGASLCPRALIWRARSLWPPSAFSDLAWRSSIRRMGIGSVSWPAGERAALSYDIAVDVCVSGGGLAGLTTARELARRGRSVALLESRRIAWSASGCNDGFVLPGFADSMDRVIDRVGWDHAKALW